MRTGRDDGALRPRLLWVTAEPPDRGAGGGNIRQSHLLAAAAAWADVDLIVAGGMPDADVSTLVASAIEIQRRQRPEPAGGVVRRVRALADSVLPGGPDERRSTERVRADLMPVLRAQPTHDLVIVEHTGLAPLVAARRPGEKWLVTIHNVPSLTAEQALTVASGARQSWLWRRELRAARRFERQTLEAYDAAVSVSDDDAAALPGPSTVIPNGVDTTYFVPSPLPTGPEVLFTGTLNYLPNVDGVEWLCREIWPLVCERVPAARLRIVGRDPIDRVTRLHGRDGIEVIPSVPSVLPYLTEARVAVVPLRQGSGTRLKALEAMSAARPLVGTSIGLAGLGIVDGRDARVRDDATSFAASIADLLTDDEAARRLADRGPAFAQHFDWTAVGARFVAVLDGLLEA